MFFRIGVVYSVRANLTGDGSADCGHTLRLARCLKAALRSSAFSRRLLLRLKMGHPSFETACRSRPAGQKQSFPDELMHHFDTFKPRLCGRRAIPFLRPTLSGFLQTYSCAHLRAVVAKRCDQRSQRYAPDPDSHPLSAYARVRHSANAILFRQSKAVDAAAQRTSLRVINLFERTLFICLRSPPLWPDRRTEFGDGRLEWQSFQSTQRDSPAGPF